MMSSQEMHTDNDQMRFLRRAFFGWQCRLRQIAMRQHEGQPQIGMTPTPIIDDRFNAPIVTVMVRTEQESQLSEIQHITRRSHDPEKRLKDALKLFSERYYQDPDDFEDTICASFQPKSAFGQSFVEAQDVRLKFRAYNQQFSLKVTAEILPSDHRFFQETYWHNVLFNPALPSDCCIIGLTPDWANSSEEAVEI